MYYMSDTEINDKRNPKEFNGITFSKFQKVKVKKELIDCIASGKLEAACYWGAEFICAGHYSDLWECLILYVSRYIHLGSPKLPIYLAKRFEDFKTVLSNGYLDNELRMRNNPKIREIFAEIIAVLSNSRKKHAFEPVKLPKTGVFDMTHMATKLKAPNIGYVDGTFRSGDPKELFVAVNEFAYHISRESKNVVSACYWVEWALEFEVLCKRRKEKCLCERRTFAPVSENYQLDIMWLIWEVLLKEVEKSRNKIASKVMEALLQIFCIKYTPGVKKRRRFVIYFAVALLCENVDYAVDIVHNKSSIDAIVKKIDLVYRDVKKNEIAPATNYLFNGVAKSSIDKTIERIEKMNSIIPGINKQQ
jgi:hypothetical protein